MYGAPQGSWAGIRFPDYAPLTLMMGSPGSSGNGVHDDNKSWMWHCDNDRKFNIYGGCAISGGTVYCSGSSACGGGTIGYLNVNGAVAQYGWSGGISSYYGTTNFVCTGGAFIVYSDQRIKTPFEGAWDDLDIINKMRVRRFTYKDPLRHLDDYASAGGSNAIASVKVGFYAQEIRDILPEAITFHRESIPDIQAACSCSGSNIEWYGSNIAVGDTLNLCNNNDLWGFDAMVVGVSSSNITIDNAEKMTGSNVFVYGHKVDDFLGVNQDCISAVTVGAVQRLSQKFDAQSVIIESLTSNVAILTARIIALGG